MYISENCEDLWQNRHKVGSNWNFTFKGDLLYSGKNCIYILPLMITVKKEVFLGHPSPYYLSTSQVLINKNTIFTGI